MSYKKYILKNGKMYGPYIYHSRRVNGKVVSDYMGMENSNNSIPKSLSPPGVPTPPNKRPSPFDNKFERYNYKNVALPIIVLVVVGILIFAGMNFFNQGISGKVVLDAETIYQENQPIGGNLKFSLTEGELIPADSKIVIENAGKTYEFNLKDVVEESTENGDFYVSGKNLIGSGEGYGVKGVKEVYPTLSFTMLISSSESSEETGEEPTEEVTEEETTEEEITEEEPAEETPPSDTPTTLPTEEITEEETTGEESAEETPPSQPLSPDLAQETDSNTISQSQSPTTQNEKEKEVITETQTPSNSEVINSDDNEPSASEASESTSSSDSSTSAETTPVTGSFILGFFNNILGFFGRGVLTGRVVENVVEEVNGELSQDSPYIYALKEGQSAGIKSGSISVYGESVADNSINLVQTGNEIRITTDYSYEEEGFGQGYISGKIGKELNIPLSELNVIPEKGELKISLVYEGQELVSVTSNLSVEGRMSVKNETSENITKSLSSVPLELSQEEMNILQENFENLSIKVTKAEVINGRLIVRNELGDYWAEFSYDYKEGEASERVKNQMEIDRMKFTKDIARKLIEESEESQPPNISELVGEYSPQDAVSRESPEPVESESSNKESAEMNESVVEETSIVQEQVNESVLSTNGSV